MEDIINNHLIVNQDEVVDAKRHHLHLVVARGNW